MIYLVGVGVVDFIEGDDRGELLVGEDGDDLLDGFVRPSLQRAFDLGAFERAGDHL